eukprot:TRINITY_DN25627_c0_g3_i1.p1 TRINITY_DN25627_c0_g3~~TRINITY_DN25627_c0_g3_i1.p1  ORF type:complete len:112 (+),score=0.71 TRINITY_DN25627_c0_g3_i1:116-451(+)
MLRSLVGSEMCIRDSLYFFLEVDVSLKNDHLVIAQPLSTRPDSPTTYRATHVIYDALPDRCRTTVLDSKLRPSLQVLDPSSSVGFEFENTQLNRQTDRQTLFSLPKLHLFD